LTTSTGKLRLPQTSSILWLPDLSAATHLCSLLLPYCNRTQTADASLSDFGTGDVAPYTGTNVKSNGNGMRRIRVTLRYIRCADTQGERIMEEP
jgi:hypothetical protein